MEINWTDTLHEDAYFVCHSRESISNLFNFLAEHNGITGVYSLQIMGLINGHDRECEGTQKSLNFIQSKDFRRSVLKLPHGKRVNLRLTRKLT